MQGGTRGYLEKMGFLHQNLLKELRRSRKAKLTPEEAGEGADPVVPESVEEEIDESALVVAVARGINWLSCRTLALVKEISIMRDGLWPMRWTWTKRASTISPSDQ